jgi:hypothetical protein
MATLDMIKIASLLLLLVAFGIGSYTVLDSWRTQKLPVVQRMQEAWITDVEDMESSHLLPKTWSQIREIELNGDKEAMAWYKKLHTPVVLNKDGNYRLEVLMVPWFQDGKQGALFQYDLIDLKSPQLRSTVWEKSRTIILTEKKTWLDKFLTKTDAKIEAMEGPDEKAPVKSVDPVPAQSSSETPPPKPHGALKLAPRTLPSHGSPVTGPAAPSEQNPQPVTAPGMVR